MPEPSNPDTNDKVVLSPAYSAERSLKNEKYYDKKIAPALARLAKACERRRMGFLALVSWDPENYGRTETHLDPLPRNMREACQIAREGFIAFTVKNM